MIHNFDVSVAMDCGVSAAVMLNNIGYWIAKNAANEKHFHDGRYWTYSSKKAFERLFPYLTAKQIRTSLDTLIEQGYLATGNYNDTAYDRTLWYALTEKGECIFPLSPIDLPCRANGKAPEGQPIPNSKPDIKPNLIIKDIAPSKKRKYGSYKNVNLAEEDYECLKKEFPSDWPERLERLSEYIAAKGDKYKNHLAVIRTWAKREIDSKSGSPAMSNGKGGCPY